MQTQEGVKLANTSDGGFIFSYKNELKKYTKELVLEWENVFNQSITHKRIIEVEDGYLDFGSLTGTYTVNADKTANNEKITITAAGSVGIIIKYTKTGLVEWVRIIDGNADDCVTSGICLESGKILVTSNCDSKAVIKTEREMLEDTLYGASLMNLDISGNISNIENKT